MESISNISYPDSASSIQNNISSYLGYCMQVGTSEICMIWNQFGCLKKALCNIITFYKEGNSITTHVNIYLLCNQAAPVPIKQSHISYPLNPHQRQKIETLVSFTPAAVAWQSRRVKAAWQVPTKQWWKSHKKAVLLRS